MLGLRSEPRSPRLNSKEWQKQLGVVENTA